MPCMSGNFHSENTILFVFKESTIKKLQRWGTPGSSAYREVIFFKHLWGSKLLMMWQIFLESDLDVVRCIEYSFISAISLPGHSRQGWWYYWASCPSRDTTLIRMPFTPPPYSFVGWADLGRAWFWARKANHSLKSQKTEGCLMAALSAGARGCPWRGFWVAHSRYTPYLPPPIVFIPSWNSESLSGLISPINIISLTFISLFFLLLKCSVFFCMKRIINNFMSETFILLSLSKHVVCWRCVEFWAEIDSPAPF